MNTKVAGGRRENDIVVGNVYDKYGSRNPIVRSLMRGFENSLSDLVQRSAATTIHEVGCGEGRWVIEWRKAGISVRGSDFSSQVIDIARENARSQDIAEDVFEVCSIYDLQSPRDDAELIVCCEVLEHLDNPERGLAALARVASNHVILSVPHEPLWRVLNMARGKYLTQFGNTPGHLQHWSRAGFIRFVERHFSILEARTPTPWTMVLCRALP